MPWPPGRGRVRSNPPPSEPRDPRGKGLVRPAAPVDRAHQTSTTGGNPMRPPIQKPLLAVLAALALVLASCGDDDGDVATSGDAAEVTTASEPDTTTEPAEDEATFPVTVTIGGTDTEIGARPESIVVAVADRHRDALRHRRRRPGRGRRRQLDVPGRRPGDRPVGLRPQPRGRHRQDPDLVVLTDDTNDIVSGLAAVDVPTDRPRRGHHARRHLRPDRGARCRDRPRRRRRRGGGEHAVRHRGAGGRPARARRAADLLPGARRHLLHASPRTRSSARSTPSPAWRTSPTTPRAPPTPVGTRSCRPSTSSRRTPT